MRWELSFLFSIFLQTHVLSLFLEMCATGHAKRIAATAKFKKAFYSVRPDFLCSGLLGRIFHFGLGQHC
jgi:hypothetical protein